MPMVSALANSSGKWKPRDGIVPIPNNGKQETVANDKQKNEKEKKEGNIFQRCLGLGICWKLGKKEQKPGPVGNARTRSRSRSRSCSVHRKHFEGAFCEHTWDLGQLKKFFLDSRLDAKCPQKSQGLSWPFARSQLEIKGQNVLPLPKEMGKWQLLLRQFWNMLWALLIGASCLSLIQFFLDTNELVNLWITLILFAMIFVMCICSWLQEMRARKVVRGFQCLLPECSQVIRDGKESSIGAPDLVVGDLVHISAGQRVPADIRLLHCTQLRLEASSITGESEPVEYQSNEVAERLSVFEARNVAFNGSLCVEGEGLGIVIRIGENTVIGQTAKLTTGQSLNESRLEAQIQKYVKFLIILACSVALVVFLVGGFVHKWTNVVQLLANGFLVCAIGMVPCGLPATVTSILTLIARRLANRNVYVKKLDICEALGQVSIIASDKTGTLTRNQMTVIGLWHWESLIHGSPQSIDTKQKILQNEPSLANDINDDNDKKSSFKISAPSSISQFIRRYAPPIEQMLICMSICNTAILQKSKGGEKDTEKENNGGKKEKTDEENKKSGSWRKESLKSVLWAQNSQSPKAQIDKKQTAAYDGQLDAMERGDKLAKRPNARLDSNKEKDEAIGTPSEVAMLNYANSLIDVHRCRQEHEDVAFEIPFNSKRKWHLKIVRMEVCGEEAVYRLFMKGASEVLATKCSRILTSHGEREFGPGKGLERLEEAYTEMANSGHRVIGFACANFRAPVDIEFSMEAGNFPTEGLTFLGTCAIMDPPREKTREAIIECKTAGIKVFMVTGDHQLTACAIARQIGLINEEEPSLVGQYPKEVEENANALEKWENKEEWDNNSNGGAKQNQNWAVVQGQQISRLTTQQWDQLILHKQSVVFARTTPEQKLLIVEQCQRRGQIIAMTGDGVNDSPALKKADIGIAMGSGSEVAKQAADIVLMDDNFSSIVRAIEEGRTMFENIKKLLAYTMPHSFPEVWPIIINFCFGMPVGITALQILSIDLGTEILPGISLAKEHPEGDVMARPPRNNKKVLISNALLSYSYLYTGQIQSFGCFLAYCCVFWSHGISISDLWMSALKCWQPNGEIFYSNGRAFSLDEQLYIGRQATSAWQMGIVFGQFFNIWSARTRRLSLFQHGFCSNRSLLAAISVELALIICYVYLPGLNEFLGGAPIPLECWVVVGSVGLFINVYNEIRKFFIRRHPKNPILNLFKW